MPSEFTVRLVTDPADPAIPAFGRLQDEAYAEPEQLIPARYLPTLLEARSDHQRNLMLVAEAGGQVIGGTVFHLMPQPNTGFSSFMAVAATWRGRRVARRLHEARFRALDEHAGRAVEGIFIDVVVPERLTTEHLEREQRVGSDPRERLAVFARLGFRRVGVRYEQPVGGPDGGPVTIMDLLYCPRLPALSVPTDLVVRTLEAYWRSWLGEARATRHALELRERAAGEALALEPL